MEPAVRWQQMCWQRHLGTSSLLAALLLGRSAASALNALPFETSLEIDLVNQGAAVQYYEDRFYDNGGALTGEDFAQVGHLKERAFKEPVLALAAAQVLYMFAWFRPTGEMARENVAASAQLFDLSLQASPCGADSPVWYDYACDIRFMHAMLLYNWLGETERDAALARAYAERGMQLLDIVKEVPRYAAFRDRWKSPVHISFNMIKFPDVPAHPVWETSKVGIGRWLEEMHPIFKAELEAILNDPRDLYTELRRTDASREHLASPGGWETVRIVRYHQWFDLFCVMAPRTCELIKTRPEIAKCNFMNVNYVKLNPGTHLKPHFGNGPRLSAHLSVLAPEPLRAGMTVSDKKLMWVEGKAIIFDDTYPHAVSHWGKLPRYVMLVWFCHPCDDNNDHGQTCPRSGEDSF